MLCSLCLSEVRESTCPTVIPSFIIFNFQPLVTPSQNKDLDKWLRIPHRASQSPELPQPLCLPGLRLTVCLRRGACSACFMGSDPSKPNVWRCFATMYRVSGVPVTKAWIQRVIWQIQLRNTVRNCIQRTE